MKHAFVGSGVDGEGNNVFGFRVGDDGTLRRTNAVDGGHEPMFLTLDPGGDHLYVLDRAPGGDDVISFAVDEESGTLSRLNAAPAEGGAVPCYCSVDATDQCILTAQYTGGTVSVLPIDNDGRVGEPTIVVEHEGSGQDADRQSGPHPHSIVPGPDNAYAYAADLGADRIFVYDLDPKAGTLEPAACGHADVHPGAGPRHIDFHPDGRYAYSINELDSTVTAFERDAETGALDPVATVPTLPDDFGGENYPADIHVHPSGDYLYGSNRGHDSIAIYELDARGLPSLIGVEPTRGKYPRNFAIDPTGEFLFAENVHTDTIVTFRVVDDGTLEPTGHETTVPSPVCMQFVGE